MNPLVDDFLARDFGISLKLKWKNCVFNKMYGYSVTTLLQVLKSKIKLLFLLVKLKKHTKSKETKKYENKN